MRFDRRLSDRRAGRRAPPPDYLALSWQLRLLTIVGLLLLVLYLMREARKPERWAWMWGGQLPVAEAERVEQDTHQVLIQEPTQSPEPDDARERVRRDAWGHILASLQPAERAALDRLLLASRRQTALQQDERNAGRAVVEKLRQQWNAFLSTAHSSLDDNVPNSQRSQWNAKLSEVEAEWQEELLPALQSPLEGRPWTPQERQVLQRVQVVLDALAIEAIRDDTVWRAEEHPAWARLVEDLQSRAAERLRRESLGLVGYAALLRQPEAYRGKLVTVRGTAQLAYQSPAPDNVLGIHQHYVLWLRPQSGPDLPLVVYALELPASFPPVTAKDGRGRGTEIDEELEVTGYFFKRWVYAAQDDLRSVPLILAATPRWLSRPPAAAENGSPSKSTTAAWLLAAVVASLGLVMWAYRATRTGSRHASGPLQIAPPLSLSETSRDAQDDSR